MASDPAAALTAAERREWEGYINGLTRAMNLKSRVPRGDEGTRVMNDLREQIAAEITRVEARLGLTESDHGE